MRKEIRPGDPDVGNVIGTERQLPLGGVQRTYQLPKTPYIAIRRYLGAGLPEIPRSGTFWLGGVKLRIIESDITFLIHTVICVRTGPFGTLRYILYRSTRRLDRIYRLFIITLGVWGLARLHWGEGVCSEPSWRDVHVLRWLFGEGK